MVEPVRLDARDFSADPQQQAAFVADLGRSLEDTGFLRLVHGPVQPATIERAYAAALAFFTQPEDAKRRYEDPAIKGQGGFTRFGKEHAKDSAVADLKEFWHVNRRSLRSSDVPWPREVPDFRPAMAELYRQLDACAHLLLEACALYLGQPRPWLREMTTDGNTVLRLAHYPPIPDTAPPGSLRAAPHEDINLITLLCAATAPGLELLTADGWLPLQAEPGELIVDTGDMLQQLTNGLFKSTTHRVSNPQNSRSRRLSMPFFVHPRGEVDLTPHPDCVRRSGLPPQFPTRTAAAYLEQRLREIGLA